MTFMVRSSQPNLQVRRTILIDSSKDLRRNGLVTLSNIFFVKSKEQKVTFFNNLHLYLSVLERRTRALEDLEDLLASGRARLLADSISQLKVARIRANRKKTSFISYGMTFMLVLNRVFQNRLSSGLQSVRASSARSNRIRAGRVGDMLAAVVARYQFGTKKEFFVYLQRGMERHRKLAMFLEVARETVTRKARFFFKAGFEAINAMARWREYVLEYFKCRELLINLTYKKKPFFDAIRSHAKAKFMRSVLIKSLMRAGLNRIKRRAYRKEAA
jgi:hypothetical protein